MFEVIFEADNGKKFTFGRSGCNYFDMDIGAGMSVTLGISQGFTQIGETVQTQCVGGRTIKVTGEMYGDIEKQKNYLRHVCAPMTSGRLVFDMAEFNPIFIQEKYYIRVYVKASPSFSAKRGDGTFMMQFYAPFPYYSLVAEKAYRIGQVEKHFRFPINYAETHRFGTRLEAKATDVHNEGDVPVPFRLDVQAEDTCSNVTVTNMKDLSFLRITGTLNQGERVAVYRDQDNAVRAELTSGTATTDIIDRIDEESTLFTLATGENLLTVTNDKGKGKLYVQFTFHPARAALYET